MTKPADSFGINSMPSYQEKNCRASRKCEFSYINYISNGRQFYRCARCSGLWRSDREVRVRPQKFVLLDTNIISDMAKGRDDIHRELLHYVIALSRFQYWKIPINEVHENEMSNLVLNNSRVDLRHLVSHFRTTSRVREFNLINAHQYVLAFRSFLNKKKCMPRMRDYHVHANAVLFPILTRPKSTARAYLSNPSKLSNPSYEELVEREWVGGDLHRNEVIDKERLVNASSMIGTFEWFHGMLDETADIPINREPAGSRLRVKFYFILRRLAEEWNHRGSLDEFYCVLKEFADSVNFRYIWSEEIASNAYGFLYEEYQKNPPKTSEKIRRRARNDLPDVSMTAYSLPYVSIAILDNRSADIMKKALKNVSLSHPPSIFGARQLQEFHKIAEHDYNSAEFNEHKAIIETSTESDRQNKFDYFQLKHAGLM